MWVMTWGLWDSRTGPQRRGDEGLSRISMRRRNQWRHLCVGVMNVAPSMGQERLGWRACRLAMVEVPSCEVCMRDEGMKVPFGSPVVLPRRCASDERRTLENAPLAR